MKLFLSTTFLLIVASTTSNAAEQQLNNNIRGGVQQQDGRDLKKRDPPKKGWTGTNNGVGNEDKETPPGKAFGVFCCKPHKNNEDDCGNWKSFDKCTDRLAEYTVNDFIGCEWKDDQCEEIVE